jgi:hypothetical protein
MYEFTEAFGCQFGERDNQIKYFEGKTGVLHIKTGVMSENFLRLRFGGTVPGFGPKVKATLSEEGGEPLNYDSLFMSADGKDPLAGSATGHHAMPNRPARENAALKPNTDYYLRWELQNGDTVKLQYVGTDTPEDYLIIADSSAAVDIVLAGVDGVWFPKPSD